MFIGVVIPVSIRTCLGVAIALGMSGLILCRRLRLRSASWLIWLACLSPVSVALGTAADIEVFTRKGCLYCAAAEVFLRELQRERPGLRIQIRDIGQDEAARVRLKHLAAEHNIKGVSVPAFYLQGQLIIGYLSADTTGKRLKELLEGEAPQGSPPIGACEIEEPLACGPEAMPPEREAVELPFLGRVTVRDLGLPLFTLFLGLLDGFNPCAMWVLLFLLSLLANLRDRTRMALIAGVFVLVSGLVYFAFMAAWLNLFLLIGISRVTQVVLGGVASVIGVTNIKDFFALGRGPTFSIPEAAKAGIYTRMRAILQAEDLFGALIGVIVLAVLVNTVELLCTAGFPAVYTEILALRQLDWWKYYGYLGLYNLAYILDDSIMVAVAVAALTHRKLQQQEGRWLKLVSGIVMLGLGISLFAELTVT